MKIFHAAAFSVLMTSALAAHAATPVINLSIGGEISPGVYGQVQFGNAPPPPVLYAEPRIIVRQPAVEVLPPIYLHVPPGHARNWAKHCRHYNACNRQVYFVRSREYEPGYREHREHGRKSERRNEERRDEWRGDERRRDDDHRGGHEGRGRGD